MFGGNGNGQPKSRNNGGFENVAEMLHSVWQLKKFGKRDERLDNLIETREMSMGVGAE
jgi:hypothetical protein